MWLSHKKTRKLTQHRGNLAVFGWKLAYAGDAGNGEALHWLKDDDFVFNL